MGKNEVGVFDRLLAIPEQKWNKKMISDITCYYCRKNPVTDQPVVNPYTNEIHEICEVCAYDFDILRKDLKSVKPIKYVSWLGLLFGVYLWFKIGIIGIAVGFGIFIACFFIRAYIGGIKSGSRVSKVKLFAQENGFNYWGN
jgi:hypothetical protein